MARYTVRIRGQRQDTDIARLCAALVAMARLKQSAETCTVKPAGGGDVQ